MAARVRSLLKAWPSPTQSDAELLRRFIAAREEFAFAELVQRYARLVRSQCRSLLPREADAEDAFQATFLTLAKSAKTIRNPNGLGPWLHGVAYRVCQNAKRLHARRVKRERLTSKSEAGHPIADSAWDSALGAVYEELGKLPDSSRAAVVLCLLEGKSSAEAAEQLGLKLGTFSARLTRAKQTLMDRLAKRGLSAGAIALGGIGLGAASVSAHTVRKTVELVLNPSIPSSLLSLTPGVLGMNAFTTKTFLAVGFLAASISLGFGTAWTAQAQDATAKQVLPPKTAIEAAKELQAAKAELQKKMAELEKKTAELERARLVEEKWKKDLEFKVIEDKLNKDVELTFTVTIDSPFTYIPQAPGFAPASDEFEKMVKEQEKAGFKLVGLWPMKAIKSNEVRPTYVFRKDTTNALALSHGKPDVNLYTTLAPLGGGKKEVMLNATATAPAPVVKDEVRTMETVLTKSLPVDREAELMKKIEELTAQLAKEKKAAAPGGHSASFTESMLFGSTFEERIGYLNGLLKLNFPEGADKKVTITFDPRTNSIVVDGDPKVVEWLNTTVMKIAPKKK